MVKSNMDKENNIYQKTKYEYCMCNILFKGLEKDKVYRMYKSSHYKSGIKFPDIYVINNGKNINVNEIGLNISTLIGCKIKLIEHNNNTPIKNIFGKYKFIKVKLPSLLDVKLPEQVVYDYYDKFYSKLYIMNRDNEEFLYPYSYIISNVIDRINTLIKIKDTFKTNEEYEEYVKTVIKIIEECSNVVCNLFNVFKINEKNNKKVGIECLNDFLEDSKKCCKICNDFINEMKEVYR